MTHTNHNILWHAQLTFRLHISRFCRVLPPFKGMCQLQNFHTHLPHYMTSERKRPQSQNSHSCLMLLCRYEIVSHAVCCMQARSTQIVSCTICCMKAHSTHTVPLAVSSVHGHRLRKCHLLLECKHVAFHLHQVQYTVYRNAALRVSDCRCRIQTVPSAVCCE